MVDFFKKYLKGDPVIWAVIFALSIFSILAVYSSTGTLAYRFKEGNTTYYIMKHGVILLIGLCIIYVTHLIPYKYYSRLSQIFLYISVPLLLFTLLLGTNINSASRWLTLPGIGLTIQTSDLAKLALIMYVARMLSMNQDNIKDFRKAFIPIVTPVIIICILIVPANLSTAALLFATSVILMFIGRISIKHLLLLAGVGVVALSLFILIALAFKIEGRIATWKNRIENFAKKGDEVSYQVEQSKIAVVTGGIIGKGPGKSVQRNFLPHPYSDFIFAIIIEEYGIAGGLALIFLYLYILYRAGVMVRKSNRTFPAFLSIGLAISLVFQAMVNMGVAVDLLPVTGQTLPLVSMGGSSLLFTSVAFGIILSVSRGVDSLEANAVEEEKEKAKEKVNAEPVVEEV
jgi:cell division protein FtsW